MLRQRQPFPHDLELSPTRTFFFFQAEDGIRDIGVTGVQTCALPICFTDDSGSVMKLNMSYRFDDDRMVYATYSEGFRNGGSNPVRPTSILPREFTSDELKNYEVGAK